MIVLATITITCVLAPQLYCTKLLETDAEEAYAVKKDATMLLIEMANNSKLAFMWYPSLIAKVWAIA